MRDNITRHLCRLSACYCALVMLMLSGAALSQSHDATISGDVFSVPRLAFGNQLFSVEFRLVADSNPAELELLSAVELSASDTIGASSFDGVTLSIPRIVLGEQIYRADLTLVNENPVRFRLASADVISATLPPVACTRPDPDLSHGEDNPAVVAGVAVPANQIYDGGPGPDGIPPIESPVFIRDFFQNEISADDLVVGVKIGNDIRAYPHNILNWHEVVNDRFSFGSATLNYCPLTGSAMLWKAPMGEVAQETFGTSGLLYNSNLIMYDRRTNSLWSQMLERAIGGGVVNRIPERVQVVETTWHTWREMYPETSIMAEDTGVQRPYNTYPYGGFRTNNSLLFPVNNMNDGRLHRKERVVGINVGNASKVYPIASFAPDVEVINDAVGTMPVVAAGSSGFNFGVVYNRELEDCTVLQFDAVQNNLPIVMMDTGGSAWDVFGTAVSGPRAGQQLQKTNSYIAYWYAWTAFFAGVVIHQ